MKSDFYAAKLKYSSQTSYKMELAEYIKSLPFLWKVLLTILDENAKVDIAKYYSHKGPEHKC